MQEKPKIHFFLPIGGFKGCFQAGFLYRLLKKYKDFFEIYQVDGSSVGCLNGYSMFLDIETTKKIWYSIKSSTDIFPPSSDMYFGKEVISLFKSVNSFGYSTNKKLKKIIDDNIGKNFVTDKLNISVVELETGKCKYINSLNMLSNSYLVYNFICRQRNVKIRNFFFTIYKYYLSNIMFLNYL